MSMLGTGVTTYPCEACGLTFMHAEGLAHHLCQEKWQCPRCGKQMGKSGKGMHRKACEGTDPRAWVHCPLCDKKMRHASMAQHLEVWCRVKRFLAKETVMTDLPLDSMGRTVPEGQLQVPGTETLIDLGMQQTKVVVSKDVDAVLELVLDAVGLTNVPIPALGKYLELRTAMELFLEACE